MDAVMIAANPMQSRPFQGWRIVAASLFSQAIQAGILIYAFGTIALAVELEFEVSRAEVMMSATALSLVTNIISPFIGRLVDTRSVRQLMLFALGALVAGLFALSSTQQLWQVWLIFGTLMPVANVLLGQMANTALISRWFVRFRGRAMGIAAVGTSVGGFIIPVLLTTLIEDYGWRLALMLLAVGTFLCMAPVLYWMIINNPADIGQNPDGAQQPALSPAPEAERNVLLGVMKERAFWCQTVAIGVSLFVYLGFLANLYPHAISVGIPTHHAAALLSIVAICAIAGKLTFGLVADYLDLRITLLTSFLLIILGALTLGNANTYAGISSGAVLFGLAAGGLLPVWGTMVARSFGTRRYGRALGAMNIAMAPITMLSAPYAGYLFDRHGSYHIAFTSYAGLMLIAAMSLIPLRFPKLTEVDG